MKVASGRESQGCGRRRIEEGIGWRAEAEEATVSWPTCPGALLPTTHAQKQCHYCLPSLLLAQEKYCHRIMILAIMTSKKTAAPYFFLSVANRSHYCLYMMTFAHCVAVVNESYILSPAGASAKVLFLRKARFSYAARRIFPAQPSKWSSKIFNPLIMLTIHYKRYLL